MRILAIDPASIKCGIAYFDDSTLITAFTVVSTGDSPLERRRSIAQHLNKLIVEFDPALVISEEPMIQGRNGNGMQRLLGYIELLTLDRQLAFIHPMTLKARLGHGSKDKLEVALAAGERLQTEEEKELMARLIDFEEWDSTDAIAIGLMYAEGGKIQ